MNAFLINIVVTARNLASRPFILIADALQRIRTAAQGNNSALNAFRAAMQRAAQSTRGMGQSVSQLNMEFQGLQIALVIKYASALISLFIALGGEAVALAGSLSYAAGALAGLATAAGTQAIPVIGLLIAAFARLGAVMEAVKAQQKVFENSAQDAEAAQERQRASAERVRNAQLALAAAERNAILAQEGLTAARKRAREELEDTILAEQRAKISSAAAATAVDEARRNLQLARGGQGDVLAAQQALDDALQTRREQRVTTRRATAAADKARAGGPEGTDTLRTARRQLEDANRSVAESERQLANAHADTAREAAKSSSSVDALQRQLALLSPAERELYNAILRLKEVYRREFRPITDIIVGSFTTAVGRIIDLLQDNKVIEAARNLATKIAESIDSVMKGITTGRGRSFLIFSADEASKNLKPFTDALKNIGRIIDNIARAAAPIAREMFGDFRDFTKDVADFTGNRGMMKDFFKEGYDALVSWLKLLGSIVNLFAALFGAGAADEGTKSVKELTDYFNRLADSVRKNRDEVRDFFEKAGKATRDFLTVIPTLGKALMEIFNPHAVKVFADMLNMLLIPALVIVIQIIGAITTTMHEFLTQPVIKDIALWVITFTLLHRALLIVSHVFKLLFGGIRLLAGAFMTLRTAMTVGIVAAGGFGAVFGAVLVIFAAITAAIILLDKKFRFLGPTWKWLKGAAGAVFDWLLQAGKDVIDWFSDVWTQGLLYWIRWVLIEGAKIIARTPVFRLIIFLAKQVVEFFKSDAAGGLLDAWISSLKAGWSVIKAIFLIIKGAVEIFLDLIAGRFDHIGKRIGDIWGGIFRAMYSAIANALNAIIGIVNLAIGAFNKIPGIPDIGKIDAKFATNYDAQVTLDKAKAGKTNGPVYAGPHAQGGMLKARDGGQLITVAEGGHDEVVLTTDPRHSKRSKGLLGEYMKRMAPHFAEGGWVQGAQPTPAGRKITKLANALIKRGFQVTSGAEYRGSGTYHDRGMAVDFGDSVNNLQALWKILFPQRKGFTEFFGPTFMSPGGGLYHGLQKFNDAKLQAGHQDHIHVGINEATGFFNKLGKGIKGAAGAIVKIPAMLLKSATAVLPDLKPGTGGIASGALTLINRMARRLFRGLGRKAEEFAAGAAGPGDQDYTSDYDGPLNRVFPRHFIDQARGRARFSRSQVAKIATSVGLPGTLFAAIARGESGYYPGVVQRDPGDGMVGYGLWQNTPNAWGRGSAAYRFMEKLGGISQLLNPIKNARMAKFLYENAASKIPGTRGFPWYGTRFVTTQMANRVPGKGRFAFGGGVPGYGGGDTFPAMLEGGEHVWTKGEVKKAGGHGVMHALRKLFGGGGQSGGRGYRDGGSVLPSYVRGAVANIDDLNDLTTRASRVAMNIRDALREGGALDILAEALSTMATEATRRVQAAMFQVVKVVGKGGRGAIESFRRVSGGGVAEAQAGLEGALQARQGAIAAVGATEQLAFENDRAMGQTQRQMAEIDAKLAKTKDKTKRKELEKQRGQLERRFQQLEGNSAQLQQRLTDARQAVLDSVQAIVEAQEAVQRAATDAANNAAAARENAISRTQRVFAALGYRGNEESFLDQQMGSMRQNIADLIPIMAQASATGNTQLADEIREKIAELETSIQELTAQKLAAAISNVNDNAGRALGSIDRRQRLANVFGPNFGANAAAISQRGAVLANQRSGLSALLSRAHAEGNLGAVEALTEQIEELDISIAENTKAAQDNTRAMNQAAIDKILGRGSALGGIFTGVQGLLQSVTGLTGVSTQAGQLAALQQGGSVLASTGAGLREHLFKIFGIDLRNLNATEMASAISNLNFDAITAGMDDDTKSQFYNLVQAIIDNATAVNSNTQAINELTTPSGQSFSSSLWQMFRSPVFTGNGSLLQQFAVPSFATGGVMPWDGLAYLHAGETITRRGESGSGHQTVLQITNPTEVADPDYIFEVAEFKRSHRRAT